MKKLKSKNVIKPKSVEVLKVKTGTIKDFFANTRKIMRAADRGESIKRQCATLTFVDPSEMLHFLSAAKLKLISSIRSHPDSITNIAKATHRNVAAVRRDIREMESVGMVKIHEEPNPAGHGLHKVVELAAPALKLEAWVI